MIIKLANDLEKEANVITRNFRRLKDVGKNKDRMNTANQRIIIHKIREKDLNEYEKNLEEHMDKMINQYGVNHMHSQNAKHALKEHRNLMAENAHNLQTETQIFNDRNLDVKLGQGLRIGAGIGGAAGVGGLVYGGKKMHDRRGVEDDY